MVGYDRAQHSRFSRSNIYTILVSGMLGLGIMGGIAFKQRGDTPTYEETQRKAFTEYCTEHPDELSVVRIGLREQLVCIDGKIQELEVKRDGPENLAVFGVNHGSSE